MLGNYIYDNTNDNNHKFLISATFGGVYENDQDREVNIEVADDLCNNALFELTDDTLRIMPHEYYSLSSSNKLIIPSGKFSGNIEVQLTDAFFDDTLAYRLGYVIPIRIVDAVGIDSVLNGESSLTDPDPRVDADWNIKPKNFTMYAVNFINPYHGVYLHRGSNTVKDGTQATVENNVYRTKYVEDNELWTLITTGKSQITINAFTHSALVPGALKMVLDFSDNGNCSVAEAEGSAFTITGSGRFAENADTWGNKERDAIHLNYTLTLGEYTYAAIDTLVIRDRAVKMQLYKPIVFTE